MAILRKYQTGGKIVPITSPTFLAYKEQLKQLENDRQAGYKDGKWYPHDKDTIGYGHYIKPGENFNQGATTAQINAKYDEDFQNHRYWAMQAYDKKFGVGSFHKLKPAAQVLATDYAYNIGPDKFLNKFPTFFNAMQAGDKNTMLREYERENLNKRNEWTKNYIINNL